MGKLIITEFMTLDGVVEAPDKWSGDYWSEEISKFKHDELFGADALLLGRVTYEGFAEAWPGRTDAQGYADRMNGLPKYVVSSTIHDPSWEHTEVIGANIVDEVTRLKQNFGKDIIVFGSIELAKTLMHDELIDEYRLLIYPVVLGGGKRLFQDNEHAKLRLSESVTHENGVLQLTYVPVS